MFELPSILYFVLILFTIFQVFYALLLNFISFKVSIQFKMSKILFIKGTLKFIIRNFQFVNVSVFRGWGPNHRSKINVVYRAIYNQKYKMQLLLLCHFGYLSPWPNYLVQVLSSQINFLFLVSIFHQLQICYLIYVDNP